MSRDDLEYTARGFAIYGRGACTKENPWRVQESSIAGDPRCWLIVQQGVGDGEGGTLHLNLAQTRQFVTHLEKFIRDRIAVYGEGVCSYGIKWRLQDEPGSEPLCFLQISGRLQGGGPIRDEDGKLWLNREQAKLLQAHLERFLTDSGDAGHWKNDPAYIAIWRTDSDAPPTPMTMLEAGEEARRRWGKHAVFRDLGATNSATGEPREFRYLVGHSPRPDDVMCAVAVRGEGNTWEEAFLDADKHPGGTYKRIAEGGI